MITSIKVFLFGRELGTLGWNASKGVAFFQFSPDYRGDIRKLFPLAEVDGTNILWGDTSRIYKGLPPFLADALPDAWGMEVFEQWRASQKIPKSLVTPLHLLSYIGSRGMGAMEFVPDTFSDGHAEKLDLKALIALSEKILNEREHARINPGEALTMHALMMVGTSAGGRQSKAIIAMNLATGEIRSGQIAGHEGFRYYILKFNPGDRPWAELEYAYYLMAAKAGIDMASSELLPVEGVNHFLTERFDRPAGQKIHMQTLAALMPGADSYEDLFSAVRSLGLPQADIERVFMRMVFNILANNTDDHNKNFSFLMDEDGRWSLSPAYDLTFIFSPLGAGTAPENFRCLSIKGQKATSEISMEMIMDIARENDISTRRAEALIRQVADAVGDFRAFADKAGVDAQWLGRVENAINANLRRLGLMEPLGEENEAQQYIINGHIIEGIRIEESYRGNIHIVAVIDGKESKIVINKKNPLYAVYTGIGLANVTREMLLELIAQRLKDSK